MLQKSSNLIMRRFKNIDIYFSNRFSVLENNNLKELP